MSVLPDPPAALPDPGVSRRTMVKVIAGVVLRVTVSITLLFIAYYQIPTRADGAESDLPWLILELAVFAGIVAVQIPAIVKSDYPVLRAVEVLSVVIPLFLLIFSRIYLSNSIANPAAFTQPLDHTTAFYFTVTVFATVGFGDITATADTARLVVTGQMIIDLIILGLGARVILGAVSRGRQRRPAEPGAVPPGG